MLGMKKEIESAASHADFLFTLQSFLRPGTGTSSLGTTYINPQQETHTHPHTKKTELSVKTGCREADQQTAL